MSAQQTTVSAQNSLAAVQIIPILTITPLHHPAGFAVEYGSRDGLGFRRRANKISKSIKDV
jgi:hypothetical protein